MTKSGLISRFACAVLLTLGGRTQAATVNVNVGPNQTLSFVGPGGGSTTNINVGDTVHWVWQGNGHSTTSGAPGQPDSQWDSGVHSTGFTFDHTFAAAGTFPYYCSVHGVCCGMTGTIVVAASQTSAWSAKALSVGTDNMMRVLWTNLDGRAALWVVDNTGSLLVDNTYGPYTGWKAASIGVAGDNKPRVLWNKADGSAALWQLAGGDQSAGGGAIEVNLTFGPFANWTARAVAADLGNPLATDRAAKLLAGTVAAPDTGMRLLWQHNDGEAALWLVTADGTVTVNNSYGPYQGGWVPVAMAVGSDGKMRLLWSDGAGSAAAWVVGVGDQSAGGGAIEANSMYGPFTGWTASGIGAGPDGDRRILWNNADGHIALWTIDTNGAMTVNNSYGPYSGWACNGLFVGIDNKARLLWNHSDGQAALWQLAVGDQSTGGGAIEVALLFGPF